MSHWDTSAFAVRNEVLFGDRLVKGFAERPVSLYGMWQAAVARHPQREAMAFDETRWTYAQADRRIDAMALGLAERGVTAGDRVVMLIGNRPEFTLVLFALQRLGAIAVPMGVREQRAGVAYVVNQSGAMALVIEAALADRAPLAAQAPSLSLCIACGPGSVFESLDSVAAAEPAHGRPAAPARPEDTALILYTSGTTGKPKGAMITHVGLAHSVRHFEMAFALSSSDRAALGVPANHITGLVAMIVTMVHVGGCCVFAPPFRAAEFLSLMAREAITYTLMVPSMYQLCLMSPALETVDLRHWRVGGYGGAPMAVGTIEALLERLPHLQLRNAYGATETTAPATVSPKPSDSAHADSVGVPLPCVQIRIVDDAGREVPAGELGELWIGGPMVVPGYWNDAEATGASFTDGFWHSGDLGSMDACGFVRILDRKKDMLNRGGFKIFSAEVEDRLQSFPGVLEAAVVGRPCSVLGERVHAFVHAPTLPQVDALLQRHCAMALTDYKVPETFTWSPSPLPRNPNGKLLKRVLRDALSNESTP